MLHVIVTRAYNLNVDAVSLIKWSTHETDGKGREFSQQRHELYCDTCLDENNAGTSLVLVL